jgi:hypothetical protein
VPGCTETGCHEPRSWKPEACKTCHADNARQSAINKKRCNGTAPRVMAIRRKRVVIRCTSRITKWNAPSATATTSILIKRRLRPNSLRRQSKSNFSFSAEHGIRGREPVSTRAVMVTARGRPRKRIA